MTLIPWLLVGLLLGALVIVWTLSKARIEGLSEDLDCVTTYRLFLDLAVEHEPAQAKGA